MKAGNGSRVQMLIIDKHIVIAVAKRRSKWWLLTCSCPESRRRKDGSCKHLRCVFEYLSPGVQARTRFDREPMGSRRTEASPADSVPSKENPASASPQRSWASS